MPSFTVTLVLLVLIGSAIPSPAQTLRGNGKIAFTSDRDGNMEIYTINPDGSDEVRLTNSAGVDSYPTWSPDGRMIAFISETPSGLAIFRMNEDGTNKTYITAINSKSPANAWSAPLSWSPDGGRIAFQDTDPDFTRTDIFVVNVDGSNRRNLTADNQSWDTDPSWSPDGSSILFSKNDPEHVDPTSPYRGPILHTIDPEGTELRALPSGFKDGFGDSMPSWSPMGDKIIFSVNVWDFVFDIFIAKADGTERRFFHGCIWFDNSCRWDALNAKFSPDDTKIVFSMFDFRPGPSQGSSQIFVKNIDGTGLTLLADSAQTPSWQPIPHQVVLGFDRTRLVAGTSYLVSVSGANITAQTFFDVRFIAPGSRTSEVVVNWQRGVTAIHEVPIGTTSGTWTINGLRPHQIETDHTGIFFPVSATLTVSP